MTDLFQGPAGEALAKAQVDIGRLEAEVSHLTDAVKELRASNAAVTKALVDIQRTLDEARGGWRTLMFVGGAAASMGGLISWVLSHAKFGG